MKKLNLSFNSNRPVQKLTTYLAVTATVAMLSLAGSAWVNRANGGPLPGTGREHFAGGHRTGSKYASGRTRPVGGQFSRSALLRW